MATCYWHTAHWLQWWDGPLLYFERKQISAQILKDRIDQCTDLDGWGTDTEKQNGFMSALILKDRMDKCTKCEGCMHCHWKTQWMSAPTLTDECTVTERQNGWVHWLWQMSALSLKDRMDECTQLDGWMHCHWNALTLMRLTRMWKMRTERFHCSNLSTLTCKHTSVADSANHTNYS